MNNKIVQKIFAWRKANSKKLVWGLIFLFIVTFIQPWVHVSSHTVMVLDEKTELPMVNVPIMRQLGGETGNFQSYRAENFFEEYAVTDKNGIAHFHGIFLKRLFNYFIWNFKQDDIRDTKTLAFKYGYYSLRTQYYYRENSTELERKFKPDWVVLMQKVELGNEEEKLDYLMHKNPIEHSIEMAAFVVGAINSCDWPRYKRLLIEYDDFMREREKLGIFLGLDGKTYNPWFLGWEYIDKKQNVKKRCKSSVYDWFRENRKHEQ